MKGIRCDKNAIAIATACRNTARSLRKDQTSLTMPLEYCARLLARILSIQLKFTYWTRFSRDRTSPRICHTLCLLCRGLCETEACLERLLLLIDDGMPGVKVTRGFLNPEADCEEPKLESMGTLLKEEPDAGDIPSGENESEGLRNSCCRKLSLRGLAERVGRRRFAGTGIGRGRPCSQS